MTPSGSEPDVSPEPDVRPPGPTDTPDDDTFPGPGLLAWPPPGLERMQGDLWMVVRKLLVGGLVLVLPLLWAVASSQGFWSLGPLGEAWWVLLVVAVVGLGMLAAAFVDLFRVFRRWGRTVDRGYGWVVVALVLADAPRDTGFLLQAARVYSVLPADTRRALLTSRLASVAAYMAAAAWLPLGFVVAVFLAGHGRIEAGGLALFTLAPAAALAVVGSLLRLREDRTLRSARRIWFQQPWADDLADDRIDAWHEEMDIRTDEGAIGPGSSGGGGRFRALGWVALVVAFLATVPLLAMVVASAVSPALARVAIPSYSEVRERAARVEPLRRFRLEPDPAVTPAEAGEILHVLEHVGTPGPTDGLARPPARTYESPWIPDDLAGPGRILPEAATWARDLMPEVANGLDPEIRAALESLADHPAATEFGRLARAATLDVTGARLPTPLPPEATLDGLPLPKTAPVRQAAHARIGRAILQGSRGEIAESEESIREVISVGFLLAGDSPMLLDNLVGLVLIRQGSEALSSLYEAVDREDDARALRWALEGAERAAAVAHTPGQPELSRVPELVSDPHVLRGSRWAYFYQINTLGPCINLHRMVFGPDREFDRWVAAVEEDLVRWPSEAELFELGRKGYFGRKGERERGVVGSLSRLALGDDAPGTCAAMYRNLLGLRAQGPPSPTSVP